MPSSVIARMEIYTDSTGTQWRFSGNEESVKVYKKSALTEKEAQEGKTLDDKLWVAVSYHNRIEHALVWLLDRVLRPELGNATDDALVERITRLQTKLQGVAEYWRESLRRERHLHKQGR